MDSFQQISLSIIRALQSASPALDGLMLVASFLGSPEFYLLLIPLVYWSIDRSLGMRVLLLYVLTAWVVWCFKLIFHAPRPYWVGAARQLTEEGSYGIPSFHAALSFAVWGYLLLHLRTRWLWVIAGALVILIGVSRVYLGGHFPQDVLFGWVIGAAALWLFGKGEAQIRERHLRATLGAQIGIGFAASLAMVASIMLLLTFLSAAPDPPEWSSYAATARSPANIAALAGTLFGGAAGYALMKQYASFASGAALTKRAGRYILGIIFLLGLYLGLGVLAELVAPDESGWGYILRYLRLVVVAGFATFGAPWIFLKLKLAESG